MPLVEEDSCNRYRFDLYRLRPLRNKVVVKRTSLTRLATVRCVCCVSFDNPWLLDLGFNQYTYINIQIYAYTYIHIHIHT